MGLSSGGWELYQTDIMKGGVKGICKDIIVIMEIKSGVGSKYINKWVVRKE